MRDQLARRPRIAPGSSERQRRSKGGARFERGNHQLKKALEAAKAGRAAAEKESAEARAKLADSNKQVVSVDKERDAMQRERDDALKQMKAAGDAKARVQALVAENSDLQQRLARGRIPCARSAPTNRRKRRSCAT